MVLKVESTELSIVPVSVSLHASIVHHSCSDQRSHHFPMHGAGKKARVVLTAWQCQAWQHRSRSRSKTNHPA